MGLAKRIAAVVVPLGLVVGGLRTASPGTPPATTTARRVHHQGRQPHGRAHREQARNASLISAIAVRRGMPAHAATIGLATALQESKLYNLRGGDRDSLGSSSSGRLRGGAPRGEILDPVHATNAFYDALERVPGWETCR